VHQLAGMVDFRAEHLADRLMPQAHAQNRDAAAQPADNLLADVRVFGIPRAGRKQDVGRVQGFQLLCRNPVDADDLDIGLYRRRLLVKVIGLV